MSTREEEILKGINSGTGEHIDADEREREVIVAEGDKGGDDVIAVEEENPPSLRKLHIGAKMRRLSSSEAYDGIQVKEPSATSPDDFALLAKYTEELMDFEREPVDEMALLEDIEKRPRIPRPLPKIENVVLAGAGGRGFIYAGVALSLDKHGILETLKRIVGTSCGAIIGAALALGFRGQDIIDILINSDFGKFKQEAPRTKTEKFVSFLTGQKIGTLFSILLYRRGLYSSDGALSWIEFMVYAATGNKDITFAELRELAKTNLAIKELYIVATNITDGSETVFSHIDTPDVKIAHAIMASMSLPGVFLPFTIEINGAPKQFIDGGVVDEFPSSLTDVLDFSEEGLNDNGANISTLGFRIDNAERGVNVLHRNKDVSAGDYGGSTTEWMQRIRLAAQQAKADVETYEKHSFTTVIMPDLGATTLDFEATPERKKEMASHGCECTDDYLQLYRGCGTYWKLERRCPDRIEKQFDATVAELVDEYSNVHNQYISDMSLDIVRKVYLVKRMQEIIERLETSFPGADEVADMKLKQKNIEVLQEKHREKFEESRERMVEQRLNIRVRLDVFSDRTGEISTKLQSLIVDDDIDTFNFLLSRDNAWACVENFRRLRDLPARSFQGGNLAFACAYQGSFNMLIRLIEIFGANYALAPGPNGLNAIHATILSGNKSLMLYLMRFSKTATKYTLYAVQQKKTSLVASLIRYAPKDNLMILEQDTNRNLLHILLSDDSSCADGIAEVIGCMCKRSPDILASLLQGKDADGCTPLHYLARTGRLEVLALLISYINVYRLAENKDNIAEVLCMNVLNGAGETALSIAGKKAGESIDRSVFFERLNTVAEQVQVAKMGRDKRPALTRTVSSSSIISRSSRLDYEPVPDDREALINTASGAKILVTKNVMH